MSCISRRSSLRPLLGVATLSLLLACTSEDDSNDDTGDSVAAGGSSTTTDSTTGSGSGSPGSGTADDSATDGSATDDSSTGSGMTDDSATGGGMTDDSATTDDSAPADDTSSTPDDATADDTTSTDDAMMDDTASDDSGQPMTDDTTMDDGVTDDAAMDDATADDTMMDDVSADDTSTDDTTTDDAETDDTAIDDTATDDATMDDGSVEDLEPFSFFVTSYEAITRLSGSPDGFGGDLRYGEEHGLLGADKICTEIAEFSMEGSGAKQWRAFLSVVEGPEGGQVDAIDRIGDGPWYDRLGRLVAENTEALANTRPEGADPAIINDLPNEYGVPNHTPDPGQGEIDNHHVLTGSNEEGRLYSATATCNNWSSTEKSADGRPRIGFSWPIQNRQHWISGQDEGGCLRGVDLDGGGGSNPDVGTVGSGGGYGGIYCFALSP